MKELEIIAHRGIHGQMTENTLDAVVSALQLGSKSVEFDVIFTKDGVVILNHDYMIYPKDFVDLLAKRDLRTMNSTEVSLLRHRKDNAKIPTLKEILSAISLLKHDDFTLHLEMKSLRSPNHIKKKFTEEVIRDLRAYNLLDSTILRSFDWQTIGFAKDLAPSLRRALLMNSFHWAYRTRSFKNIYEEYKPVMISPKYTIASKQMIEKWKSLGVMVNPYTVNDIDIAKQLVDWGVDGVTTDVPEEMLEAFSK